MAPAARDDRKSHLCISEHINSCSVRVINLEFSVLQGIGKHKIE